MPPATGRGDDLTGQAHPRLRPRLTPQQHDHRLGRQLEDAPSSRRPSGVLDDEDAGPQPRTVPCTRTMPSSSQKTLRGIGQHGPTPAPKVTVYEWRVTEEGPLGIRLAKWLRFGSDIMAWLEIRRDPI